MTTLKIQFVIVFALCCAVYSFKKKYAATWESLDSRPLPLWYDKAKIGIFIHWGVFSVPSLQSEWFWYNWKERNNSEIVKFIDDNYPKGYSYQEFAKEFTAEFFDPDEWVDIFKKSGAKYVVLTTKHHEGFTLWPSKSAFSWNAVDVGPHRDIVDELSKAVRKKNLHFGVYHSLFEWFNPLYLSDAASNFTKNDFVVDKTYRELIELVKNYKPDLIWSDGSNGPDTYWQSTKFLAWLYNESPVKNTIVVNDRWGDNISCHHGGYFTCKDRYNPGILQKHKWENAMTLDKHSWGYRRNAKLSEFLTTKELIDTLVETVSCGGNLLVNVGPTKDGIIVPIFEERLTDLGNWLLINGEAIYESSPWVFQNDTRSKVWYTSNKEVVYAIVLSWPANNVLKLGSVQDIFNSDQVIAVLLGDSGQLKWKKRNGFVEIYFPNKATVASDWAWVVKIL